jgi:hypothetical protein
MTQRTPSVVAETLSFQKNEIIQIITVGTAEWFAWLESATVFTYCEGGAIFTAQKRARKGRYYWYAYAKRDGRLQSTYLGRVTDITTERLQATMSQFYPIHDYPMLSYVTERYGARSARGTRVQQQLVELYTRDTSHQHHLDLVKVKEQLQQLGEVLRRNQGRVVASEQVLAIAHALLLAFEQMRDANAHDLTIIQGLLRDAQERVWGYEALFHRQGRGEVF